jgi:shikimate dehydrogenase
MIILQRPINLALIGKNIKHSKSPYIYKKIFNDQVNYSLLDFEKTSDLPNINTLLKEFDGVSITAPFKKHYYDFIDNKFELSDFDFLNTLYKIDSKILGANTDLLAFEKIISKIIHIKKIKNFVILGNGPMSKITQFVLGKKNIKYCLMSRSLGNDMNVDKIESYCQNKFINESNLLIINTCSRDYIFNKNSNLKYLFYDFNYQHENIKYFDHHYYIDGEELLFEQALITSKYFSLTIQNP